MSTFLDNLTVEQAERIVGSNLVIDPSFIGSNVAVTAGVVTEDLVDENDPTRVYGIVNLRLCTAEQEAKAIQFLEEGDLPNAIRQNMSFSIRPEDFGKFARGINYIASIGTAINREGDEVVVVTGLANAPVVRPRPSKFALRKKAEAKPVAEPAK